MISNNLTHGKFNNNNNYFFSSEDDNDEERVMHSQRDNIKVMISDEADEIIKKLFHSLKNKFQNNLQVVSWSSIMFRYCIINAIK